jgi:hypothetical protein
MVQTKNLGRIRITSTPRGEALEDIRKEWIGVEIPCLFYEDTPTQDSHTRGVLSEGKQEFYKHYVVFQSDALIALRAKSPRAADWWAECGYTETSPGRFSFDEDCAHVIDPVLSRSQFLGQTN